MKYDELIKKYQALGFRPKKYGRVREAGRWYDLYKIVVRGGRKTLLITTGFHGEEGGGPLSLVRLFPRVARYAQKRGVTVVAYVCVNPSGFDKNTRYNSSGEEMNNDFLRYEMAGGKTALVIHPWQRFLSFRLVPSGAKEVRELQKDLKKSGLVDKKTPAAVLDIHQDDEVENGEFYAYIFDSKPVYEKVMREVEKFAKRSRNIPAQNYILGKKVKYEIDKDGFIYLHDGTLADMFYRRGTRWVVTAETKSQTPLARVARINWIWIKRMIDLAASSSAR